MISPTVARRVAQAWIAASLLSIAFQLYRARNAGPELARRAESATIIGAAVPDSIPELVASVVGASIFGLADGDATSQFVALNTPSAPSPAPPRLLRLRAIVGPPWRAVIEADGDPSGPLVVELGDTVRSRRVVRITADSISLRKGREVIRYGISGSWSP